jgi:WD40 repeat protein
MDAGPHPANKVDFDRSGTRLAVASDDATVKLFDTTTQTHIKDLNGHEDAVQAVLFDPMGKFLVSASSDCTFRIWS